jgi:hypothetical protein
MMRAVLAAFAALVFVAVPSSAQPSETAEAHRQLTEAGRWVEQYSEAVTITADGARELNQAMQSLAAAPVTPERAAAAAPAMLKQIERSRADVRRSNAMLEALPALPGDIAAEMKPEQLLANARAHNARILAVLDASEAFIHAMGKGDRAAMGRALPKMLDGAFTMLAQRRLLLRTRQATVPPSDSGYQALGVSGQIYRTMEAVLRGQIAARSGSDAQAAKTVAAVRDELGLVAVDTRALAVEGRRNLARELAELDASSPTDDPSEARLTERVRAFFAAEEKMFTLADRLIAFAEANKGISAAQLRAVGPSSATAPLRQLEEDQGAITLEQAALLAAGE